VLNAHDDKQQPELVFYRQPKLCLLRINLLDTAMLVEQRVDLLPPSARKATRK
jgi:hypothetical protein